MTPVVPNYMEVINGQDSGVITNGVVAAVTTRAVIGVAVVGHMAGVDTGLDGIICMNFSKDNYQVHGMEVMTCMDPGQVALARTTGMIFLEWL